jgi:hypothetical protein
VGRGKLDILVDRDHRPRPIHPADAGWIEVRLSHKKAQRALRLLCFLVAIPCFAQTDDLPRFAAGAKFSTLGVGIEAATAVNSRSNVRGGVNFFSYEHSFTRDGINYDGTIHWRSVEAHYDWYLGHGFRVSPGMLVYNGNRVSGTAFVPGGRSFNLGGQTYISNPGDPVTGTANVHFSKNKVAPMITAGFGNILRKSGRLTATFEAGVAFESTRDATLNLTGSVCPPVAGPCQNVATTPQVQENIRVEENKINNGLPPYDVTKNLLKYYPVISIGIGYRFK